VNFRLGLAPRLGLEGCPLFSPIIVASPLLLRATLPSSACQFRHDG